MKTKTESIWAISEWSAHTTALEPRCALWHGAGGCLADPQDAQPHEAALAEHELCVAVFTLGSRLRTNCALESHTCAEHLCAPLAVLENLLRLKDERALRAESGGNGAQDPQTQLSLADLLRHAVSDQPSHLQERLCSQMTRQLLDICRSRKTSAPSPDAETFF